MTEMTTQDAAVVDAPHASRRLAAILGVLAGAALLIRVVHYFAIVDQAFIAFPLYASQTDLSGFWQWSGQIVAGDWLGEQTWHPYYAWMQSYGTPEDWARWWGDLRIFQQEPFYPYALAVLRSLGLEVPQIILLQLLVGALQPLVIYFLAKPVLSERGALIAAAISAVYGPLVFETGTLQRDWIGLLLEPTALILLMRGARTQERWPWLVAGVLVGVALWTKSAFLLFLPLLAVWLVVFLGRDRRKLAVTGGILAAGIAIGFSPLVVRNVFVGAPPLSVTNRAVEAILIANAADSNPLGLVFPKSLPMFFEKADASAAKALWTAIESYDGDWVALIGTFYLKVRGLVDPFELPNNVSFAYGQEISPVLRVLPAWGAVLPLAVAGMVLTARVTRRDQALLLMHGFTWLTALMLMMVLGRYRLALMPVAFVYAGAALDLLLTDVRAKRWLRVAVVVGVVIATAIVQQVLAPVRSMRTVQPLGYSVATQVYCDWQDFDRAAAEAQRMGKAAMVLPAKQRDRLFGEAVKLEAQVRLLAIETYWDEGRRDRIPAQYQKLVQLGPSLAASPDTDFRLGRIHVLGGQWDQGIPLLERFLQAQPDGPNSEQARTLLEMARRGKGNESPTGHP